MSAEVILQWQKPSHDARDRFEQVSEPGVYKWFVGLGTWTYDIVKQVAHINQLTWHPVKEDEAKEMLKQSGSIVMEIKQAKTGDLGMIGIYANI